MIALTSQKRQRMKQLPTLSTGGHIFFVRKHKVWLDRRAS